MFPCVDELYAKKMH